MATESNVFEAALALPEADRARLARELIASLDAGADEGAGQAWGDEIERRLKEIDDGAAVLEDWDTVRSGIAARLAAPRR